MNKKLLFGIMSLAALAACTNDDFENQGAVAEQTSPIQFELINGNDASMRASWSTEKNAVSFSAADGDLFTLYHGGTCENVNDPLKAFENATYKATKDASSGTAKLTTPSMIKKGKAVMVWPADTAFLSRGFTEGKFHISIPAEQTDYVNQLPYVSDLIDIKDYTGTVHKTTDYNTEGYNRTYPIFMRQMGSLLTLKADYVGNGELKKLEEGEDGIKAITVDKITLSTGTGTEFTKMIPVKFTAENAKWPTDINHAWEKVTAFDVDGIDDTAGKTTTLSAEGESLLGNQGAKIVMLPQKEISGGVTDAAVVVDTYYGRVVVAAPGVTVDGSKSKYTDENIKDAWIRYIKESTTAESYEKKATDPTTSATDADQNGKYKTTSNIADGMMQTINWFSSAKSTNTTVEGEPVGGLLTRYVKVDLSKLDMSKLHIKDDKQLRDVARVWQKMGLDPVTVYLDGDAKKEFAISQKTIKVINDINDAAAKETKKRAFTVMPCQEDGEKCTDIVITGGGDIQNIAFIKKNGTATANVVLADEGTAKPWKWNGTTTETKKVLVGEGVERIINKGTMVNGASATLATWSVKYADDTNVMTAGAQSKVVLQNDNIWNIDGGILIVQFPVINNGTVNIAKVAQYRQDGLNHNFVNNATDVPERFGGNDSKIGVVINKGVFATVNDAKIQNRGLIKHDDVDAKTYITTNETEGAAFKTPFGSSNKKGMIILPWANRFEDNVSVSAAATAPGFVAVETANSGVGALTDDAFTTGGTLSTYVNYIMINGDVTEIQGLNTQFKYVEIHQTGEVAWKTGITSTYTGLMVLSDVNIKLGTTVNVTGDSSDGATYLGADMYVGGKFTTTTYNGYYGDTSDNVASKYITY